MSNKRSGEQGMVSILVVMILAVVITLIVLGFAQVIQRNQRETLDSQLSTQAYYAAESGINLAADYLSTNPTASITSTSCSDFITNSPSDPTHPGMGKVYGGASGINILNNADNTRFTCLMVNTIPGNMEVKPLNEGANTVWHLENSDGNPFTSFTFSWTKQPDAPNPDPSSCSIAEATGFPAHDSWPCEYGILRVDLVAVSGVDPLLHTKLEQNTGVTSLYLIPSYSTGTTAYSIASPTAATGCTGTNCPAQLFYVKCPPAGSTCTATLNMGAGWSSMFYARLSMAYQNSGDVQLSAADSFGPTTFKDGQAIVDATGQAQDELRRVQVRVPLTSPVLNVPAFALQSTDSICKQTNAGPAVSYLDNCP